MTFRKGLMAYHVQVGPFHGGWIHLKEGKWKSLWQMSRFYFGIDRSWFTDHEGDWP